MFFGTVRHRLWQKIVMNTPLLLPKTFGETRIFLKHRIVSPRKLSVLWVKKLATDNSEIHLLSVSFFDTWFFLKHRRVALLFWYWQTQTLTKNRDTRNSSLIHKIFRYPKFSETQTCSPKFWTLWDKNSKAKKNDIPLLCVKFFGTRFFS